MYSIDADTAKTLLHKTFLIDKYSAANSWYFNGKKPIYVYIYLTKKENAPLRTVKLSGRSQVIGMFSLYQCKGMPGTAASHIFCNLVSKLF